MVRDRHCSRTAWSAALVLMALIGLPPVAAGEPLSCPPLKLAPRLAPDTVTHGKGLLWRLERGSIDPSYIFGTIHVSDARILNIPAPFKDALRRSRSFVMEALFDEQSLTEFATLMHYGDTTELEEQVGRALFERTQELLAQYGIPPVAAQTMRPWAAFMTLNQPSDEVGLPLDLVLMQEARARQMPVYGLETLQEQAEVLQSLALADQIALLRDSVCYFDLIQEEIEQLERLYLDRDLAGIVALTLQYEGSDPALGDRVNEAIIVKRNRRMVQRMRPRLAEGGALVAIGALHLPGDAGVLSLLEQQGYRVTPVY